MAPEMNLIDQEEKTRLEDLSERKKRGKGPPKKGNVLPSYPIFDYLRRMISNLHCINATYAIRSGAPFNSQEKVNIDRAALRTTVHYQHIDIKNKQRSFHASTTHGYHGQQRFILSVKGKVLGVTNDSQ